MSTKVKKILQAHPASDGAGVKIKRVSPRGHAAQLDPFLMLDEIRSDDASDYAAGFPPHPHRGFETITYMRQGTLEHEDHMGNKGIITDGGAQWMTAGKGVIHSEMPKQTEGAFHGFQLWLNLPASEKMQPAQYHDITPKMIPNLQFGSHKVRVLAGHITLDGTQYSGPITSPSTQPLLLDIELNGATQWELPELEQTTLLAYLYQGDVAINGENLTSGHLAMLEPAAQSPSTLRFSARTSEAKLLLLGGMPINEPVVQYGPFVMNTREEIEQAISDYQQGALTA